MGDRGIDLQSLLRNAPLFFFRLKLECPHIVEPIGKLDDDGANVLGHGNENLPMVFGSEFHVLVIGKTSDLGQCLDKVPDFLSEFLLDFFAACPGVLYRIVKKAGANRLWTDLELSQNIGHAKAMANVGVAGFAELPFVLLFGESVGSLDQCQILWILDISGIVVLQLLEGDDFVLKFHRLKIEQGGTGDMDVAIAIQFLKPDDSQSGDGLATGHADEFFKGRKGAARGHEIIDE